MGKKQWKTVAISVDTLLLLFLLVFWVFRDHYQEILRNTKLSASGICCFCWAWVLPIKCLNL